MNKKLFCLAPWVYSHVDMLGERALCCQSEVFQGSQNLSLEEFWNSSKMKSARTLMMEGTAPLEYCDICLNSTLGSDKPLEMFTEFSYLEDELLRNTSSDGTFNGKPFFYDYRISNDCNLSCRMCCAEASSKIESGVLSISSTSQEEKDRLLLKKKKNVNIILPEILNAIESNEIRELYFASGEAVLQREFWTIIDCCLQNNVAEEISFTYHTNLSLPLPLMKEHFQKFSKFKNVKLIVSIDGEGEDGEFIRDGLKWNRFVQNLEYTMNKSMQEFAITLTIPTLLGMPSFLKFLYHYKLKYNVNICHLTGVSGLMSPLALDRASLNELIQKTIVDIGKYSDSGYFENFLKVLTTLKTAKLLEDEDSNWKKDFCLRINRSEELDNHFKRKSLIDYYDSYPITRNWINKIKKHTFVDELSSFEEKYLIEQHSKYVSTDHSILISHKYGLSISLDEILNKESKEENSCKYISLVGSAPSLINKFLSKSKSELKYNLFKDFKKNRPETLLNYPKIKILKAEYIGVFSYLFRNHKELRKSAIFFDFLTLPLRKVISFHYYVLLKIDT